MGVSGPERSSESENTMALSRTVRLMQFSTRCSTDRLGPIHIRPLEGFRPNTPQHEAGMRIDPAPSLACATGSMPDATAAAEPPEDPPVE